MESVCCGKRWDVLIAERDGRICGALPFLCGSKFGMRYVLQPQLTMFTGPWLAADADSGVLAELMERMAARRDAVALLRCAPSIIESDVFERAGWQVGQRYTWRFDALRPLPQMLADASQLRRRDFARNSELLTVDYCVSPAELASLHDGQYRRQGKRDVVDAAFMARVAATAVEHGNGVVAGVSDAAGTLQAAVFVAYDSNCAYLLLLARGAEAPRNAMAYLVWRIVEWLTSRTRMFDFEGGAEPGVGEYYRSFGACQVPYLQLTRCRMPLIGKMLGL